MRPSFVIARAKPKEFSRLRAVSAIFKAEILRYAQNDRLKETTGKMERYKFNTIDEAIDDITKGKMIILVDDEDRENEGDLCMAAEKVTPQAINFMAKHGRGAYMPFSYA